MQGPGKKDPAADLRSSLVNALMDLPFVAALSDRRMLLTLVRGELVHFPDVEERAEARLHVVDIVLACLGHPGGLRALRVALEIMAPYAEGTRRAKDLIESAAFSSVLPESELAEARALLREAEEAGVRSPLTVADQWLSSSESLDPSDLSGVFTHLAMQRGDHDDLPAALSFVEHVAWHAGGSLARDLRGWTDRQAEWLVATPQLHALRDRLSLEMASDFNAREQPDSPVGREDSREGAEEFVDGRLTHGGVLGSIEFSQGGVAALTKPIANIDRFHIQLSFNTEGPTGLGEDEMQPAMPAARRDAERLPQVWGDIPPRNPNFTGREGLLRALRRQLATGRETAVLPRTLHGMGGVGKSQVAIEYVHRYRSEYDLIWWISAEQPGQILSGLTDLALRLGLDVSAEAISAVPAVREALSTGKTPYENWLLVFDNAESLSDVRRYFPTGGAGKILVTSRNPEWAEVTQALEVDVFTRAESKDFLTKRIPELSEADADKLAEALGDLPLAVEQAAAWRIATGMPVDEYLRLFEDQRIELLELGRSPDYELSVAAAWNVSIDKLEQVNEAALQLLQVCSFFAPEPISRDLLVGSPSAPITELLDEMLRDPIKLARAVRDIQRYALAKFDHHGAGSLQMHRLVQAVLVGRMDPARRETMQRGSHTMLANGNPNKPSVPQYWPRYQALRPHVAHSRAIESSDPWVHQLLLGMVEFLYYWGDNRGCIELAEELHDRRKRDLGEDNEFTLKVAKWRSWILVVLGRFLEAAEINRRTLELSRAAHGDTHDETLDAITRVAIDLRVAGDFAGALALDRTAVETCRREFGEDDPATLRAASHLGVSLRQVGAFAEALILDEDTYRRQCLILGEHDDATMRTLNNLTMDRREAGDYIGARTQQEEVYEMFTRVLPPENPAVALAARNLAVARRKAGDHEGARRLAEETLSKFQARYGDLYPDTMAAAMNLAVDLRQTGDLEGARELGERTLARYTKVFGELHPFTLSARANLAIVLRLLGELTKAHDVNGETLDSLHSTLGPDHPTSLTCATNLASDLCERGHPEAAYDHDVDTLERSRRRLGENHPSTLACALNVALDLRALDRIQEADKMHAETMVRFRRVLGDRHPATHNALLSIRADCDLDPLPF